MKQHIAWALSINLFSTFFLSNIHAQEPKTQHPPVQPKEHLQIVVPKAPAIEVVIQADKHRLTVNDYITLNVTVKGGEPPYSYYWWLDGDSFWTEVDSNIYARQVTKAGTYTIYLVVKDQENKATKEYSYKFEVVNQLKS